MSYIVTVWIFKCCRLDFAKGCIICLLRIVCKFCKFNFYVDGITFENIVLWFFPPSIFACKWKLSKGFNKRVALNCFHSFVLFLIVWKWLVFVKLCFFCVWYKERHFFCYPALHMHSCFCSLGMKYSWKVWIIT